MQYFIQIYKIQNVSLIGLVDLQLKIKRDESFSSFYNTISTFELFHIDHNTDFSLMDAIIGK